MINSEPAAGDPFPNSETVHEEEMGRNLEVPAFFGIAPGDGEPIADTIEEKLAEGFGRHTPQAGDPFPNSTVKHGTLSGAKKHSVLREKACPVCNEARREYHARIDALPTRRRDRQRIHQATLYALNKLRQEFGGEYETLYKKERFRQQEFVDGMSDPALRQQAQLSVHVRARRFAQAEMRSRYPERYKEYYVKEKSRLKAQDIAETDGLEP